MAENQPEQHEKTEEPTQKKLEDAHKKANVAKSQEVNTWFIIFAATLVVLMFANSMMSSLAHSLKGFLGGAHAIPMSGEHLVLVSRDLGSSVLGSMLLPIIVLMVAAVLGNLVQHKPVFSWHPAKPKLNKVSPLAGFKRLFSKTSLVNFAKGLVKLGIVSLVMFAIAWPNRDRLDQIISYDPLAILPFVKTMTLKMLGGTLAVLTIVAALDFAYQRHTWWQKQKMTPKELRDEQKQVEGDPLVKAKLRQIRMERGRKRMMANVPKAAVVITNPTHYSIALQYEEGMDAPICLAKGVDNVALKIREIAGEHDIPLVENPPLARALYATVELEDEIPPEHYKAVAEVIGFVMRLRGRAGPSQRRT